jgi:hypothetical protein
MNEENLEYWKNGIMEHWEKPGRKMEEHHL